MLKKVLVFPCGSITGIDINFALRHSMRIELFGASSIEDHGRYIYKNYIGGLPNISEKNFIQELNRVIQQFDIQFIIPTHDTVALFLVKHQSNISAKIISGDLTTTETCRYKSLTYELFKEHKFVPQIFSNLDNISQYPVFLKPDDGQGGKGTYTIHNKEELQFHLERNSTLLISEYLPGEEVTVDCFTDKNKQLRYIGPRSRNRVWSGVSVNSRNLPVNTEIEELAGIINQKLDFRGYWFFQLKKDRNDHFKLLEISTRMAGTSCLNRNLDINFPLLSILDFSGEEVEISPNRYDIEVDRTLINRYKLDIKYQRVYLDFDDTLILNHEKYNEFVFFYLYQCLNKKIEVILLTKHEQNIFETLKKLNISEGLFSKIIHIKPDEYKYNYIDTEVPAIFIDNSFKERKQIRDFFNIPSFDVSNIECLIDWRG
jgi:hypothetical protein